MKNINVPSYNSLLSTERRIRSIQELYDYISRWKGEVDGIEEVIPSEASPTNQLADKAWVTAQGGGGSSSEMTIVNVASGTTAISAELKKYYNIAGDVGTLAITLPAVTDNTKLQGLMISMTTGTTPNVTIAASGGATVKYFEDYSIEASTEYELNIAWNGSKWIVAYGIIS